MDEWLPDDDNQLRIYRPREATVTEPPNSQKNKHCIRGLTA